MSNVEFGGWPMSCRSCEVEWTGMGAEPCWICGGEGESPYLQARVSLD